MVRDYAVSLTATVPDTHLDVTDGVAETLATNNVFAPHTRGCADQEHQDADERDVRPADTGMNRRGRPADGQGFCRLVHARMNQNRTRPRNARPNTPRMRGDEPTASNWLPCCCQSAPHTREIDL